jgi:hypothetical protein
MRLTAALTWDPQIRGALILVTALLILPGSVYLLLATNLGARLGLVVAMAGFFGWLALLGLLWTIFGIGIQGRAPAWEAQAVVAGPLGATARPPLDRFPAGWKKLPEGEPARGEAQATADHELTEGEAATQLGFKEASDYKIVDAYEKGGETYLLTLRHKPHHAVVQAQKVIEQEAVPGQPPPKVEVDPKAPVVTILMVRDLGSRRVPSFLVFLASAVIFGVIVYVLHHRDKVAMAEREA